MNILQEAMIALLSGLTTKNEDGSINWEDDKILYPLDIEQQTYIVKYICGDKLWYKNGQLHREDGPAIEWISGSKEWHINGKRHREDGPAIEWISGTKEWWVNGLRHRKNGPAVESFDGFREWYQNGIHKLTSWTNDQTK